SGVLLVKVRVEAEVRPTEFEEKVEAAVKKIFPTLELGRGGGALFGEAEDVSALSRLHQLLRIQAILDTARSVMLSKKDGNAVRFTLNKQAAFVGKVSFTEGESPLGPITVTLEAEDIERLIDYLAPRTRDGKPVQEITFGSDAR
ncbi:MAG: RNA-binding domain-containing protein, partial [Candidatus Hadarchaeota archaeon]